MGPPPHSVLGCAGAAKGWGARREGGPPLPGPGRAGPAGPPCGGEGSNPPSGRRPTDAGSGDGAFQKAALRCGSTVGLIPSQQPGGFWAGGAAGQSPPPGFGGSLLRSCGVRAAGGPGSAPPPAVRENQNLSPLWGLFPKRGDPPTVPGELRRERLRRMAPTGPPRFPPMSPPRVITVAFLRGCRETCCQCPHPRNWACDVLHQLEGGFVGRTPARFSAMHLAAVAGAF